LNSIENRQEALKMQQQKEHEIIKEIEAGITLVKTKDIFIPYNLIIHIEESDDMKIPPPEPYSFPSNKNGSEGIGAARAIKLAIMKKVYPDTWEIRSIKPTDNFSLNKPIDPNHAGYHYVRYKSPCLTRTYPVFEAKAFDPKVGRQITLGLFGFGTVYSGNSLETAFYKACIEVDSFYGLQEKTFQEYIAMMKLTEDELQEVDDFTNSSINKSRSDVQNHHRKAYLHKYTTHKNHTLKGKPLANLFTKRSIEEFKNLPCGYPYLYYYGAGKVLSAQVPAFEDNPKMTIGAVEINKKNYAKKWIELAQRVDKHFKREVESDDYYKKLLPSIDMITKKQKKQ